MVKSDETGQYVKVHKGQCITGHTDIIKFTIWSGPSISIGAYDGSWSRVVGSAGKRSNDFAVYFDAAYTNDVVPGLYRLVAGDDEEVQIIEVVPDSEPVSPGLERCVGNWEPTLDDETVESEPEEEVE
jgi:hypothetical protein